MRGPKKTTPKFKSGDLVMHKQSGEIAVIGKGDPDHNWNMGWNYPCIWPDGEGSYALENDLIKHEGDIPKPEKHEICGHWTTDSSGKDYLQRFFETKTDEEIHGAMTFLIGKYIDRLGKKDDVEIELYKVIDYSTRYRNYLLNK